MKRTKNILKTETTESTKKSKGFLAAATDTFHELFLIFVGVVLVGGLLYALFEDKNVFEGLWWSLRTAFAISYGDIVPHTAAGQVVGTLLMSFTTYVFIPLVTALLTVKYVMSALRAEK